MATKPKPATPPKPDPARLSCLPDSRNKEDDDEIFNKCSEMPANQTKLLKRGSTLPPKPALYPKPQAPIKKPLEKVRPQVPRRPEHILSLPPNNRQSSNLMDGVKRRSNLSLVVQKAPVAKLEEFDSLYEKVCSPLSPVRPPRSPKIKGFPDGPFEKQEEKPKLPMKQRQLSSLGKDDKDWDNIKKRSASLGRSENNPTLLSSMKCFSLSRKLSLEDLTTSKGNTVPVKASPIPPPRRRKKSDGTLPHPTEITAAKIPIYAQVNYEMKKNRRSVSSAEDAAGAVVEGRLLLAGNSLQSNNNLCLVDNTVSDPTEIEKCITSEEVNITSMQISNLISDDKSSDNRNEASSTAINAHEETKIVSPTFQQPTDNNNEDITSVVKMEVTVAPRDSELFRIVRNCEKEVIAVESVDVNIKAGSNRVDFDDASNRVLPINSYLHGKVIESTFAQNIDTKTEVDASVAGGYNESTNVFAVNVVLVEQHNVEEVIDSTCAECNKVTEQEGEAMGSNNCLIAAQVQETISGNAEMYSEMHGNLETNEKIVTEAINPVVQLVDNTATTKESQSCVQDALTRNTNSCSPYTINRPISSSDVSDVSDLVVAESQLEEISNLSVHPKVNRRQSWSSSQETSSSPDHLASRKIKHRSGIPWCDEGDLSNGALADSDTGSSDNMARKSSEDLNKRVNGSGYTARSKIANWFDSFGKGAKKRERKTRTPSQFYAEGEQQKEIEVVRPAPSIPGQQEVLTSENLEKRNEVEVRGHQEDQLGVSAGVQRTPSGVSDILDNIPPAEHDRDSESETEDIRQVSSPMTEEKRRERRVFFIAQELMTSERQFVDVLKLLNVDFVDTVKAAGTDQCPVIPPTELSKILDSLPQLQSLNEEILRDLELRIKNWSSYPKIADIIVKKGPFLKLYSTYIKNFGAQCKYLDDFCLKYPKFYKVMRDFEASPICKKLGVKHYMLKPVQRIPQYRLLLEDYQRKLEPTSLDYKDTEDALKIVREVADHANRTIKLGDHLSKLMELQSQLYDYEIIKPGRTYLKDGELFKLSRKVRHPRYFILLNDCLLYTSRMNTSLLRVNKELPLAGMKVFVPQGDDNLNEFNIISIARSFTLSASSAEERREWIEALESAIKDHTSRKLTFQPNAPASATESLKLGHQAPVWIQDARVTMCQSCTAQFTLTYRRHHCRACGKVVCGACSEYRAPLRYRSFQAERVCEDCYDAILHEFSKPLEHNILIEAGFKNPEEDFESIKSTFKKLGTGSKKKLMQLKDIPQRLKEVAANDAGSQVSGWLHRKARRGSWKVLWFVLKEQVLYVYKAQEDVVALESIPILGYKVEAMAERHFEIYEGIDAKLVFQLSHPGQQPLVFHAKDQHMSSRWIKAMEKATVLH